MSSVIKLVANEASKCRPSIDLTIWVNVAKIVFIIEELVLDKKPTNIIFKEGVKSIYDDYLHILNTNMIRSSENRKELSNSISKTETCIIDDIFKVLNYLWPSSLFETREICKTKESKILDILSQTSDDDFAKDAGLLMYSDQKDKKSPSADTNNTFLRSIVNLACLKISTIDNTKILNVWLSILLRIAKYLLLISETWTTKDSSFYKTTQNNIAESLAFIIIFLYRELICCSTKENAKALSLCLEEIMVHFLITVNYSDIKYTPQQLKQTNHKTASKELMNSIFIITKDEPIISAKILESLKLSDYKNISKELFSNDRWRSVINDSQRLEEIVESHISFELLEVMEKKKIIYAKNTQQIEISADRAKDDKANKIHTDIMEVAMKISEQSFEVKNKSLIKNEQLRRDYRHEWKNTSEELVLWKGLWRDQEIIDHPNTIVPNTVSNTIIGGISKCALESRTEQDYVYFNKETSDRHIKGDRINLTDNDSFSYSYPLNTASNIQTNRSGGDNSLPEIKIFSRDLSDREIDIISANYVNYLLDIHKTAKVVKQFDCNMIKPLYIRSGQAVITQMELYFFDDLKSISSNNSTPDTSNAWKKNIEFIHYRKKKDSLLFEKWDISEINSVFYRNFLSKDSSAEIFFNNNSSLLLFFMNPDERDSFCKQLYKNRDKKEYSKSFLVTNGKKAFKERKFTERWMNWEISTFEYLMNVNIYANRGYNDISHYPVFPWLHVNSEKALSIEDCKRDLTKNMGQLGSKDRIEELMRKYEEGD